LLSLALREAHLVLRDRADAEDAAQAAVLRAWRHRASCRDPSAPGPWVRSIARREAIRAASRRGRQAWEDLDHERLASPDEPDRPASLDVRRALAGLSPQDREIFVRHYWAGQSCDETAAAIGMPAGTIKVRLHRGRRRLRADLEARTAQERARR
jgi:RNA polymerase sigma-70 factor (ECF subfamily)